VDVAFHPLVVRVRPETDDSATITFDVPEHLRDLFRHEPGQHVVLRADIDGEDVRRSYSICSAPGAPLRVGVKRIPGGRFSTWATTELRDGDRLDVLPPIGEFVHRTDPTRAASYVLVAAGSGITPILAMATTILATEPESTCTLVYGNRRVASIMFLEELEALKNRWPDRFRLLHVLSREPHDIPLFTGRIDLDKVRMLAGGLIDVDRVDSWYLCGPLGMVEDVQAALADLGVPAARVHAELFYDERVESVPEVDESSAVSVPFTVTIDGRSSTLHVDPDGPSLLDYARTVRSEVPFACKGGMCATCKAKVLCGEVTMAKNYALTPDEVADGFVLTCQAHPVAGSDPVTVSFDVHGGIGR